MVIMMMENNFNVKLAIVVVTHAQMVSVVKTVLMDTTNKELNVTNVLNI